MKPRRRTRVTVEFPVTLQCGRRQFTSTAREMSEFGIVVAGRMGRTIDTAASVELALGAPAPELRLSGTVASAHVDRIAIRFKGISGEQSTALKGYIQMH